MSAHNSAVFNNSCLKVPRNPSSNHPSPIYEHEHKKYLQANRNATKEDRTGYKKMEGRGRRIPSCGERSTLKSFIEFYDSIPEYEDVNHLPSKEFYRRLENLREKQRMYFECVQNDYNDKNGAKNGDWVENYKKLSLEDVKPKGFRKTPVKPFCTTPILNKNPCLKSVEETESITSSDKENGLLKPPSRRSVRIETPSEKSTPEPFLRPKSRINPSKSPCSYNDSIWDDLSSEDIKSVSRSAPTSPVKNKPSVGFSDGITIPKPFQMTVRDEENRIIDEVIATTKPPQEAPAKSEMFRAHPVPIESQIPLFDKIMEDQEIRSQKLRRKRKAQLRAQMKPFSFTKREEELQALSKRLWKSSPSIFLDDVPVKVKQFKAKPVPKNLFSNYIYKKMHEDEFYRSLQRKVRAEELLRASSLPPSMAKREKTKPKYDVCPRSFRDTGASEERRKNKAEDDDDDGLEDELEALKEDFITVSPKPARNIRTNAGSRNKKRSSSKRSKSSTRASLESRSSDNRSHSSLGLSSVNRSNLAAVLRIQSANSPRRRRRMEMDMCKKLEEARLKEESRWREKVMRKRPAWQSLAYSNEEDLAMRLQMRRDEQKLRNEEHRYRMQQMLGRVNQQPTLFERQSMFPAPANRDALLKQVYKDLKYSRSPDVCSSDSSGKRSSVEMKDEAVQAYLEGDFEKSDDEEDDYESDDEEEKEKCDCRK